MGYFDINYHLEYSPKYKCWRIYDISNTMPMAEPNLVCSIPIEDFDRILCDVIHKLQGNMKPFDWKDFNVSFPTRLVKRKPTDIIKEGEKYLKTFEKQQVKKTDDFLNPGKCVYCNRPIKWGLSCEACGRKEDEALGKYGE